MVIVDVPSLLNWMFYGYSKANENDKIAASDAVINYIDKILHPKVKEYKIILVPPYQNYRIKLSNSKNADLMRKIESMLE